ncbi:MAG TPA: hypothetical protein DCM05_07580 [Elusimicrobia bacterium]|nr:hypothetical protein [Elusimicrobiota bacterium]
MNDNWDKLQQVWAKMPDTKRRNLKIAAGAGGGLLALVGVVFLGVSDIDSLGGTLTSAWDSVVGGPGRRRANPENLVRGPSGLHLKGADGGSWPTGKGEGWKTGEGPKDSLGLTGKMEGGADGKELNIQKSAYEQNTAGGGAQSEQPGSPEAASRGEEDPPSASSRLQGTLGFGSAPSRGGKQMHGVLQGIQQTPVNAAPVKSLGSSVRSVGAGNTGSKESRTFMGGHQKTLAYNLNSNADRQPTYGGNTDSGGGGGDTNISGNLNIGNFGEPTEAEKTQGISGDPTGTTGPENGEAPKDGRKCSKDSSTRCEAYSCANFDAGKIRGAVDSAAKAVDAAVKGILAKVNADLARMISEEQAWIAKTNASYTCDTCSGLTACANNARGALQEIVAALQREQALVKTAAGGNYSAGPQAMDAEQDVIAACRSHSTQASAYTGTCTNGVETTKTSTAYNSTTKKNESVTTTDQAAVNALNAFNSYAGAESAAQQKIVQYLSQPWTSRYPMASAVDVGAVTKAAGDLDNHAGALDEWSDLIGGSIPGKIRSASSKLDQAADLLNNAAGGGGRNLFLGAAKIQEAKNDVNSAASEWSRLKASACGG